MRRACVHDRVSFLTGDFVHSLFTRGGPNSRGNQACACAGSWRTLRVAAVLAAFAWMAPSAIADPNFVLETEGEWNSAMATARIEPVIPPEWDDYMMQWGTGLVDGDPYPPNDFIGPQLYVWGGGGGGGADPEDAGLVMTWGNPGGPLPDGSYSSAWDYVYGADPDLSNSVITITVTAPDFINVVSFGIKDMLGRYRAWYWFVGPAASIQPWTPTAITINTSKIGLIAATPTADAYMNTLGFDITQTVSFIVDENANWVGAIGVPPPGQVVPMPWNYWHNLIVQPFGGPIKWAQPPTSSDMSPFPECYWGWDEVSIYNGPQIVADDWRCTDQRPITDIHWWGSYRDWDQEFPPPNAPDMFHIGIWTDMPAGATHSHPDRLIRQWFVPRSQLYEHRVGCDFHPEMMNVPDACFRYDFYIPELEWFYQEPGPTVYWLSISAIYPGSLPCPCDGDVNGDGSINVMDLSVILSPACWMQPASACPSADVDCDGIINQDDVLAVQCQITAGFPDPACCIAQPPDPENPWGWKTREHYAIDDAVRVFNPTAPDLSTFPPIDTYMDGEPIVDAAGNSWDMAFVLTTDREPPITKLKWDQPPVPANPDNVYYGWNDYSVWDPEFGFGQVDADDWFCDTDDPVTKVRWWGSYIGWRDTVPPPETPSHFHINVWKERPGGCTDPLYGNYSCPEAVIHEVLCYNFTVTWVGWDYNPATNDYESCFLFEQDLLQEEYFYQDPAANQIYWLSIAAHYDDNPAFVDYPWGWKTLPRDPNSLAPDDAVRIFDPPAPIVGSIFNNGEPIWWPDPVSEDSWDLAFELIATPQGGTVFKWEQAPDLDLTGLDVNASSDGASAPYILADDFQCTVSGPLTDFHIYGSWRFDEIPGSPDNVTFFLSIHEDWPVGHPQNPNNYSIPGDVLWMQLFPPGTFGVMPFATGLQEGWLDPPDGYMLFGDTVCWLYEFFVDPLEAFQQEAGKIYWVDVQAIPGFPNTAFGWKTSLDNWNDDAVWGIGMEPFFGPWEELRYPPGHPFSPQSIDLAFSITGEQDAQEYVKWSQPPEPYVPDDGFYGWNEWSVYGSNQIAADDWLCDTDEPVTDIHWWGSFINWSDNTPPPDVDLPIAFHIAVWTDSLCTDAIYGPYSCPDTVVWENYCDTFTYEFVGWDWDPRDPLSPPEACFKFSQLLDDEDWFFQSPADNLYWISIAAVYPAGMSPQYPWGWKTLPRDPSSPAPDDAVRIFDPTSPAVGSAFVAGSPIWWPNPVMENSWDLAFQLTTRACFLPGDVNGDGLINGLDIQCFVECLVTGSGPPACNCACCDMQPDGYVDMLDVPGFVSTLLITP